MMKRRLTDMPMLLVLLVLSLAWLPARGETPAKPGADSEGEMSYTESGKSARIPMHVLGGVLGQRSSHGVRAELFVLQAEHPEQLRPADPNHLFTVALKDEASGKLLAPSQVTLGFAAAEQSSLPVAARAFQGMFRAGLRLPAPGSYTITVVFRTADSPVTLEFPYRYDAVPEAMGGHVHPAHSQAVPAAPAAAALPVALQAPGNRLARSELQAPTPAVDLTDSNGQHVSLRGLLDQQGPVLVNFIFTSCQAVCPLMSESFARLQRELGSEAANVRLVSISIDPEFDRPEVLRTYALRLHAGPQWHFLTGSPTEISRVQAAFGTLRPNKMDHAAVVLLRGSPAHPWTRLEGLASAADLLREYHALQP